MDEQQTLATGQEWTNNRHWQRVKNGRTTDTGNIVGTRHKDKQNK